MSQRYDALCHIVSALDLCRLCNSPFRRRFYMYRLVYHLHPTKRILWRSLSSKRYEKIVFSRIRRSRRTWRIEGMFIASFGIIARGYDLSRGGHTRGEIHRPEAGTRHAQTVPRDSRGHGVRTCLCLCGCNWEQLLDCGRSHGVSCRTGKAIGVLTLCVSVDTRSRSSHAYCESGARVRCTI